MKSRAIVSLLPLHKNPGTEADCVVCVARGGVLVRCSGTHDHFTSSKSSNSNTTLVQQTLRSAAAQCPYSTGRKASGAAEGPGEQQDSKNVG